MGNFHNYGREFFRFCDYNNIGQPYQHREGFIAIELNRLEYQALVNGSYVTDARNGGLIIGNFHTQGGIHMLQATPDFSSVHYIGEMEGYEYLFVRCEPHEPWIHEINQSTTPNDHHAPKPFSVPWYIDSITLPSSRINIILIPSSGSYIINRKATQKHLKEIDRRHFPRKLIYRLF